MNLIGKLLINRYEILEKIGNGRYGNGLQSQRYITKQIRCR